jgi:hypothetical protein
MKPQYDPNKGIPAAVLERYEEASLARCMANLVDAIDALRQESHMEWSEILPEDYMEFRRELAYGQLTIKRLNAVAQRFGLEPHVIFRPRTLRNTVEGRSVL